MPKGRATPNYKFRLLCRRCNSYMWTSLTCSGGSDIPVLKCEKCDNSANHLDESDDDKTD
jgi:transcription elongation factor Elf1